MKKILTIALALVMVLAAVPAMAFTGTTTASATRVPKLSIYLVEYSDAGFFGMATLPAADRGYAKNEVVAAIAEIAVPDLTNATTMTGYSMLKVSGTNVSLNVTDRAVLSTNFPAGYSVNASKIISDNYATMDVKTTALPDNATYKALFFAKIIADGASLTVTLVPDGANSGDMTVATPLKVTLNSVPYSVVKSGNSTTGYTYAITVDQGGTSTYNGAVISLYTDGSNKTIGMAITPKGGALSSLGVAVGGVLGVVDGATILTSGTATNGNSVATVLAIYNDVVKGVFGLDYFKIGNYLYDSFFTGFTATATITATVAIKPWTAYVTVPSTTVVTPPKTGDAAGIMGFVMIVLAAAAAVVVKEVRA